MALALLLTYTLITVSQWRIFHSQIIDGGTNNSIHDPLRPQQHSFVTTSDPGVITLSNGNQLSLKSNPTYPILENLPSVDYYACCGLGHRLIRMSSAAYIAKNENFALRSFWGWCGEKRQSGPVEVYSHLFQPQSYNELQHVIQKSTARNQPNYYHNHTIIPFYNEVPGFRPVVRHGGGEVENRENDHADGTNSDKRVSKTNDDPTTSSSSTCPCHADKIQSDYEFYLSLRGRYRDIDGRVKHYLQEYFHNTKRTSFVIGIHIRAGNGETAAFERKGPGVSNPQLWVQNVVDLLLNFINENENQVTEIGEEGEETQQEGRRRRPILYIATDTPSMIEMFRNEVATREQQQEHVTTAYPLVLDLPQPERPKEGQGVLFGESDKVHNKASATVNTTGDGYGNIDVDDDDSIVCLKNWRDTITDMILLSYADVVIAGKPSSFSQTLPMSLAFGATDKSGRSNVGHEPLNEKKLPVSYCEIIPQYEIQTKQQQQQQLPDTEWQEVKPKLQCFSEYMDWCCNHSTWIKFSHKGPKGRTKIVSKEFVVHPTTRNVDVASIEGNENYSKTKTYPTMRNRTTSCLRPRRGRIGGGLKDKCLPHEW